MHFSLRASSVNGVWSTVNFSEGVIVRDTMSNKRVFADFTKKKRGKKMFFAGKKNYSSLLRVIYRKRFFLFFNFVLNTALNATCYDVNNNNNNKKNRTQFVNSIQLLYTTSHRASERVLFVSVLCDSPASFFDFCFFLKRRTHSNVRGSTMRYCTFSRSVFENIIRSRPVRVQA